MLLWLARTSPVSSHMLSLAMQICFVFAFDFKHKRVPKIQKILTEKYFETTLKICSPANPPSVSQVPNSSEASNAVKASTAAAKKTNRNGYRWEILQQLNIKFSLISSSQISRRNDVTDSIFSGLKSLRRSETLCGLLSRRTPWWSGWGRCRACPPRARPTRSAPRTASPPPPPSTTTWTTKWPTRRTASPRCKTLSQG